MKKLATTFGLLTLMLVVTSFTTPSEIGGGVSTNNGGKGSDGGLIVSTSIGGGVSTNNGGKGSDGGLIVSTSLGGKQSTNNGGKGSDGGL